MNTPQIIFASGYALIAAFVLLALRLIIASMSFIPVIRFKPCRDKERRISLRLLENRRQQRRFLEEGMVCRDLAGVYSRGAQFWMRACDISEGGVGFVGTCRIPRGTDLEVKFHYLGKDISFKGHVIWMKRVKGNQYCGGVRFHPEEIPTF